MVNRLLRCGFLMLFMSHAWASEGIPLCLGYHENVIAINDAEVIGWKQDTNNQFKARAHVRGIITQLYPSEHGHIHFEILLDGNSNDTLEVVYNDSFGELPQLKVGMSVEACGDYITSFASTDKYPASPDGAIIHWVHRNPSPHGHPSGFLVIDGIPYGEGEAQSESLISVGKSRAQNERESEVWSVLSVSPMGAR